MKQNYLRSLPIGPATRNLPSGPTGHLQLPPWPSKPHLPSSGLGGFGSVPRTALQDTSCPELAAQLLRHQWSVFTAARLLLQPVPTQGKHTENSPSSVHLRRVGNEERGERGRMDAFLFPFEVFGFRGARGCQCLIPFGSWVVGLWQRVPALSSSSSNRMALRLVNK